MKQENVEAIINEILERQGKERIVDSAITMQEAGFRSIDFSELAIRLEARIGRELNFDAAAMRSISTINDVVQFFLNS